MLTASTGKHLLLNRYSHVHPPDLLDFNRCIDSAGVVASGLDLASRTCRNIGRSFEHPVRLSTIILRATTSVVDSAVLVRPQAVEVD